MPRNPRDYKDEYAKYQGKPSQIKRRSNRNKARRKVRAKLGDGMDVHHKDGNPNNNSRSNLSKTKPASNRSFPRNKKAGKKKC